MKFQEDLGLREKVFRKMGWRLKTLKKKPHYVCWVDANGKQKTDYAHRDDSNRMLKPVESRWEVCADLLVKFMRYRGYRFYIEYSIGRKEINLFIWFYKESPQDQLTLTEIKNDNIPRAACEAFLEVKL